MVAKFTNNAVGTLASSISNVETSITVSGSEGDRFPSLSDGDFFHATLVDADGNREIVKVTARVGNTMTVERAQEGTSARAFDAGSILSLRLTASALNDLFQRISDLETLLSQFREDVSGRLVTGGTSTAYTLTTSQGFMSLEDGITVSARLHVTNGDDATLSVDGLTAKPIRPFAGTNISIGSLIEGAIYSFTYDSADDSWLVRGSGGIAGKYVGEIFDYAGTVAPAGCMFCYGQAISRTTYAAAFSVLNTTFGGGDGSTTFNLPDLRGRVVAGKDDMGGTSANRLTSATMSPHGGELGAAGGDEVHTLIVDEMPEHDHDAHVYDPGHSHTYTRTTGTNPKGGNDNLCIVPPGSTDNTSTATTGITVDIGDTGGGEAHNNVQPTFILNKCIFLGA